MHQVCLTNLCLKSLKVSSLQDWILLRFGSQLKPLCSSENSGIIDFPCLSLLLQSGQPDDISEHPLDNVDLLQDQLDCFPHLCRFQVKCDFDRVTTPFHFPITLHSFVLNRMNFLFQYENSSLFIIKIMEPILQIYVVCCFCMTMLYIYELVCNWTLTYCVKTFPFY